MSTRYGLLPVAFASLLAVPASHAASPSEQGRYACTARVSTGTFTCQALVPGSGGTLGLAAAASATAEGMLFSAPMTLHNGKAAWLGTSDGHLADPNGMAVRLLGAPVTTEGAGAVRLQADASGALARYVGVLAPGGTSAPQRWTFVVPAQVEAFTVQVALVGVATIPPVFAVGNTPAVQGAAGSTETITATVRTASGLRLPASGYTWTSSAPAVATVSATGEVSRVDVGNATVTLSANGVPAAQYPVQVCTGLAVGEVYHFSTAQAASFCVGGGQSGAAEYTLIPTNLQTAGALSLSVTGSGIQAVTGPPSPLAFREDDGPALPLAPLAAESAETNPFSSPAGAAPQRVPQAVQRAMQQRAVPNVGDSLDIQVAEGCTGTPVMRRGGVRYITPHFIVVFDGNNPVFTPQYTGNPFTPDTLGNRLERIAWPAITGGFGEPTDLDGNGRTIVFYTSYLNSLSPPASSLVVEGLIQRRDLFSQADCPRSNEGEVLYQMVPDPTGSINSNVRTESSVIGGSTRVSGGLTARLISQSKRLFTTGDTQQEEPWLEQGLVGIAEELMFYSQSFGLAPRQNIVVSQITTGPNASRRVAAFNTYANQNYGRLRSFLQRPDTSGAFRSGTSLASRGVAWAFLRYAVDRRVTEGGVTEASVLSALAGGQAAVGRENLRLALGLASTAELEQWYRAFLVALYADDAVAGVNARYTFPSWSLRSLYIALNGTYQLGPRPLTNGVGLTLNYASGGSATFQRFGVAQGGFASFSATRAGNDPAPMRFSIVRTK